MTISHIVEELDEGIACCTRKDRLRVANGEAECKDGNIPENCVERYSPEQGLGKRSRSIIDFFGPRERERVRLKSLRQS